MQCREHTLGEGGGRWERHGIAWHVPKWFSMVWHSMRWYSIVWNGMGWYSPSDRSSSLVWYGMICAQLALHCMARYIGMAWYGMD